MPPGGGGNDAPVQAIELPKISSSRRRCRRRRVPMVQTAEQLVEVPEFVLLAALMQQDIAVHGSPLDRIICWCGNRSWAFPFLMILVVWVAMEAFKAFSPGQGTPAADVEQIVDIPVLQDRREGGGGLQGCRPGQNSTAYLEQIVDFPARGGLHGFLPGKGSSSWSRLPGSTDEGIQRVFALFPVKKKVRRKVRTRGQNWVRTLLHGRRRLMTPPWQLGLGLWRS